MQHIQTGYSSSVEANYITTNNITTNHYNSGVAAIGMTIVGGLFSLLMGTLLLAAIIVTAPVSIPVLIWTWRKEKNRLDTTNAHYSRILEG